MPILPERAGVQIPLKGTAVPLFTSAKLASSGWLRPKSGVFPDPPACAGKALCPLLSIPLFQGLSQNAVLLPREQLYALHNKHSSRLCAEIQDGALATSDT